MVGDTTIVDSPRNDFELPESHQHFSRRISSGSPESDKLPSIEATRPWDPEELSQSSHQLLNVYSGIDGNSSDNVPRWVKIYLCSDRVYVAPADESLLNKTYVDWSEPLKQAVDNALLTPEVRQFAAGVGGLKPPNDLVKMVDRIVRQVNENLTRPEVAFDDDDGSLNLDLRLNNGDTAFIEFYSRGTSFVGVYAGTLEEEGKTKLFLSDPTENQLNAILSE